MRKHYKKILLFGGAYSFGYILRNIISFLFLPLYTYYLYPKDFGIIALMEISIGLIVRLISPIAVAFGRFYYKPDYREKNGVLLFNLFFLLLLASLVLAFIFWCISEKVCFLLFGSMELIIIVRLYTVILFFTPVSVFLLDFVRLKEMARFYTFITVVGPIISSIIILFMLINKFGILSLVYGYLFGHVFIIAITLPVAVKNFVYKLSSSIVKEPLAFGYQQILVGYSNLMIDSGDRYILKMYNPVEVVGIYSFGYKIAGLLSVMLVEPVKKALSPIVLKKENNLPEQREFLAYTATYYYFAGMLMALGLSLFGKELIMLMARKKEFWQGWVIVPIITFSYVQHGLGHFAGWGMVMKNKAYHMSMIIVVCALVNIGLNFLFIPRWGIVGAAVATLIAYVVWNYFKMYYSSKFYGLKFQVLRLLHIAAVGILMYVIAQIMPVQKMLINLFLKAVLFVLFPVVLYFTGFLEKWEKKRLKAYYKEIREVGVLTFIHEKYKIVSQV